MKRIVVDETYCTGCRYCEIICSLTHENEVNPRKSGIQVTGDVLKAEDIPIVCDPIKCETMPCIESCPVNAITKDKKLNFPIINKDLCTGCRACINVCPINAIFFDEEENKALKCDLCNGDPQCVKRCVAHIYLPHIPKPVLQYK